MVQAKWDCMQQPAQMVGSSTHNGNSCCIVSYNNTLRHWTAKHAQCSDMRLIDCKLRE